MAGEDKDGGMLVVGAVVLEAIHTETVLVAGVEGGPCPTNGVINLRQDREKNETIYNTIDHTVTCIAQ